MQIVALFAGYLDVLFDSAYFHLLLISITALMIAWRWERSWPVNVAAIVNNEDDFRPTPSYRDQRR